jgi:uncharacterized protein YegJ (DUF2314 family)
MHRHRIIIALPVLFAFWLASGCGEKKEDRVVRREGEPDFVQAADEELMDAAIAEAKSTLGTFVSALQAQDVRKTSFNIKKGYAFGREGKEFIWISEVKLVGTDFEGRINNEPVNDIGVKLGQTVRVKRDEVADWMFMDGGRLQGGYTIVALVYGSDEQKQYEKNMQIDWSQYKFLKKKE